MKKPRLHDLRPVIVMSRGHSGTRVLAWALHHLGVRMWNDEDRRSGDANRSFNRAIKKMVKRIPDATASGLVLPEYRRRFEKAVMKYYTKLGMPASWGWKFPETYLIAPYVHSVFPHAYMIHMIRDGRDIAWKYHLTDDPGRKAGRRILSEMDALSEPHRIQAALSWKYQVDAFDRFCRRESVDVLCVYFEKLCSDPCSEMERVCRFIGVSMNDACRRYLSEEIDPTRIAEYRLHSGAGDDVEARIASTLRRHGYIEPDA